MAGVLAFLGALVGEFVGATAGLGMLLLQFNNNMQVGGVFAVLLVLGVIGSAPDKPDDRARFAQQAAAQVPGLRILEKHAIRAGGGSNHRFGLDDAVLIKDNHVAVAGGIRPAIERAKASVGHLVKIEIEVDSLEQLDEALACGADAVMIGRAAQGRPWIFREIAHYLQTSTLLPAPYVEEVRRLMSTHLQAHYAFYGEYLGVRTARKHIGWYVKDLIGGEIFRQRMNLIEECATQLAAVDEFFESQLALGERLQYAPATEKWAA